ncbi:DEAD-box ATP-dependent RNA helicase CshA [Pseudoclavibacter triregionum]|nr:DEAD-box ATP-dependent RNA helicase CshA [Pseudoclavibacter triregionum]
MNFSDLNVDADLCEALAAHGITEPFPIQEQTIPLAISGQDIIGQAKTGTGKTLGFGLPLIQRLGPDPEPGVQALVVVPTRELAVQVYEDLVLCTANRPTKVAAIYGGKAYEGQIEEIKAGAQIIVGTPGRLLDLGQQRLLSLANVREMVLDEADKMLDLGFLPDIERLFAQTPATRHTMLFSATMPGTIVNLARRFMNRPVHIRATDPDEGVTQANIEHHVYRAHSLDKDEMIARILQAEGRGKTVIFTRTKRAAAKLMDELADRGFNVGAVHGDLNQEQRERHMAAFKAGKRDVLIATDVAARGIDVDDVTHVINHTIPDDEKTYLHRVGRTGRAGNTGIAVTFVDWDDLHKWGMIARALELPQIDPPETYSSSPHLYTDLRIPEGTKGRLPGASKSTAPRREPRVGAVERRGRDGEGSGERRSRGGRGRTRTRSGEGVLDAAQGEVRESAAGAEGEGAGATPRRRRRRRGGRGRGRGAGEGRQGEGQQSEGGQQSENGSQSEAPQGEA